MQVTETQIDELTRQFRIAIPAAEIEQKVETRLSELAHSARLPGFRPGKVPIGLLRKRYGASVKSEIVDQAINESSQEVINDRGLRAALPPRVELASLPEQGDLEYTMAVELIPEITPPDYAQINLDRLVAHVDEAEIERRLRRFADAVGEETTVEGRPAAPDDIVVLDVLGPDDRWPFDTENSSGVRIRIGSDGPVPGFGEQLQGLASGDRAKVTVTFPDGIQRRDLAGQIKSFDVEIKEVRSRQPAEIDDELAKKGGWESLEDLRKWLREQHDTELRSLSRLRLKRALLDRLAELYAFAVPAGLLDREYRSIVGQLANPQGEAEHGHAPQPGEPGDVQHIHDEHCGHDHDHPAGNEDDNPVAAIDARLSEEQRREYRTLAERRVRLGLVLAEIGRTNNLRVAQEELAKAMVAHARRFPGQEQAVLDFLRKNPDAQQALAAPILEEKVVDFILEMARITERPVASAELLRDPDDDATSSAEAQQA